MRNQHSTKTLFERECGPITVSIEDAPRYGPELRVREWDADEGIFRTLFVAPPEAAALLARVFRDVARFAVENPDLLDPEPESQPPRTSVAIVSFLREWLHRWSPRSGPGRAALDNRKPATRSSQLRDRDVP
jgi:hypothetical protein